MNNNSFQVKTVSRQKGRPPLDKNAYISREGKYKEFPDLLAKGSFNIPQTFGDAKTLWKAAEKYERKNGHLYTDIQANLPFDMTASQYGNIVKDFVRSTFSEKTAVVYAIHNKKQLDGKQHPHLHLMFSNRQFPEGFGFTQKDMFKRDIAPKYEYSKLKYLYFMKDNWAESCNKALIKAGRLPDMESRSYKELRQRAMYEKDDVGASLYHKLNFYRKGHNDQYFKEWDKERRRISNKKNENKGEVDMATLSEIQKNSMVDERTIKRTEYRDKLAEHKQKLLNDRKQRKERNLAKNPKNEVELFLQRVKECNRLYKKSFDFEDISRTKIDGMYSDMLNEDTKNYKINLPHFIADGELVLNKDVINTRNVKQLSGKVKELSKLKEGIEQKNDISQFVENIGSDGIRYNMSNGIIREELEKRAKKKSIGENITKEIVLNIVEYQKRTAKVDNNEDDVLTKKKQDKAVSEIKAEIFNRNLANAYLLYKIEDLDEKILNTDFKMNNSEINLNEYMTSLRANRPLDIASKVNERLDKIQGTIDKGFDEFAENRVKGVTTFFRYKNDTQYTKDDLEDIKKELEAKKKSYEDDYLKQINEMNRKQNAKNNVKPKKKNWLFFKSSDTDSVEIEKPVKKELSETDRIALKGVTEILTNPASDLNKKIQDRKQKAWQDFKKLEKTLSEAQKYQELALELCEFEVGYKERQDKDSFFSVKSADMSSEIDKFRSGTSKNNEKVKEFSKDLQL